MPILHIFCEVLTKWRILRQKCADTVAVFNSGHVWGHMPYVGQRSNDLWHNACTSYDLWIRNEDKYDNTGSVTGEDITWEVWFHDNLKVNFRHFWPGSRFCEVTNLSVNYMHVGKSDRQI